MSLLACNEYKSPNYDIRKNLNLIDTIIIHYTGMHNAEIALNYLCDKKSKVSAHYFINEEGKLWQIVEDKNIAWHAGVSKWLDIKNLNETSIGIELENPGHQHGYKEFTFDQYEILEKLINSLNLDNWIVLYIFFEINLIKELGFDTNLNFFDNSADDIYSLKKIKIDEYNYEVPIFLIKQEIPENITKILIKKSLTFTRNIFLNKFFIPNNLLFPKSRIILENYFN